jgi:predicted extracellular nuclease
VGFAIAFYNVENLFDTLDDPHKTDNDFLPGGKYAWNTERYRNKLARLTDAICAIDSQQTLGFVGLAEIENRAVLQDLTSMLQQKGKKYAILHFESPDRRGIDVAALYRPQLLLPVKIKPIAVADTADNYFKTRDILYAQLADKRGQNWHFYVNHWPSRLGGQEKSEPKRLLASGMLRQHLTDSVFSNEDSARVCIMGDFNDYPDNRSILELLGAGNLSKPQLVNLSWDMHNSGRGTHNYNCHWGMLDQMLVSEALMSLTDTFYVFKKPRMLYYNKKCKTHLPSRTLSGSSYFNGYSDHLPVVLQFK